MEVMESLAHSNFQSWLCTAIQLWTPIIFFANRLGSSQVYTLIRYYTAIRYHRVNKIKVGQKIIAGKKKLSKMTKAKVNV